MGNKQHQTEYVSKIFASLIVFHLWDIVRYSFFLLTKIVIVVKSKLQRRIGNEELQEFVVTEKKQQDNRLKITTYEQREGQNFEYIW